ncbi:MAG: DUF2029 domain-containing protein [Hyphomicrobiales bacterium]|nr:DUF2029 domain-containing protein [Hyphomicrobiales bacterium]
MRAWLTIAATVAGVGLAALFATSHDGRDAFGHPLGTDFVSFWTAARVAIADGAAAAWDGARLQAEQTTTWGIDDGFVAFFYPPPFLAVVLPLGLLGYFPALAVWLATTGSLAFAGLATLARGALDRRTALLAFVGFPATLATIGHGQNAFLSTALFAFGARAVDERPILAGAILGGLVFKPQLAIGLPVVLAASGRWRAFVATGGFALFYCVLAWAAFGEPAWSAFLEMSKVARATLDLGLVEPGKMVSVFAAARVLGGSTDIAWGAQAAASVATLATIAFTARRASGEAAVALAAVGTFLAAPFALDYDLMILAVPMVGLAHAGIASGFRRLETGALVAGFALPMLARPLALSAHLPIAPLVMALVLVAVARREGGGRDAAGSGDVFLG